MRYKFKVIITFIVLLVMFYPIVITAKQSGNELKLSSEELNWLQLNKGRSFVLGATNQDGYEYFEYNGIKSGYMKPLADKIGEDLGIEIKLRTSDNWSEIYLGLQQGAVDILCGANETAERDKTMCFTKPFSKTPYIIISKKDGPVHTIGDLDGKKVGFLQNDFAADSLSALYKNIQYSKIAYSTREAGIEAVDQDMIEAFITSGGPIIYGYMYKYPELSYSFKINALTSDMTFATRKEDKILAQILDKELKILQEKEIPQILNSAEVAYNLSILKLTDAERNWLSKDGTAVVGITKDYIPFDYYENGEYKGIDSSILNEISRLTGIRFKYEYAEFEDLQEKLKKGEINILNIAKTKEREDYVIYPMPFSTQRDIIVGRKEAKDARDIFGLEGKKVAVIKGFWHYDLLNKNLTKVSIISTDSIQESMKLVNERKADYLIENPEVVRYYIEELGYYDLVQRGATSSDSFLYFGVSKNKPELAGIINKVLPMMDIENLTQKGYEEVPHEYGRQDNGKFIAVIAVLVMALILIILFLIKIFKDLIRVKMEKELLKQREYLLSIDTLTGLNNRNFLVSKLLPVLDDKPFPQAIIAADVNELKFINDNYGHNAGDILLKIFADVLKKACPEEEKLFRIGGDEFLIIMSGTNEIKVQEVIAEINRISKETSFILKDNRKFYVSAALGYAVREAANISFEELSEIADREMYTHKRKSKTEETR